MSMTLTADQQNAYSAFSRFITCPDSQVFVLEGYSGTGKSTLVKKLLADLDNLLKTFKLLNPDNSTKWSYALTATTNKAAENLQAITGEHASTIHSYLGLRVHTDFRTNTTKLIPTKTDSPVDTIIFVDEASYMDKELLQYLFSRTEHCKFVLIGDPAQLLTVGCVRSPVFDAGFETAKLEEVVRQAEGNQITELATLFRHTVNGHGFPDMFVPNGTEVIHLSREQFEAAIIDEYTRPDYKPRDAMVLAWTNKCVIAYNKAISSLVSGDPNFSVGDYAVCNSYYAGKKGDQNIKTDQQVLITDMVPAVVEGINGHYYELNHRTNAFMPDSLDDWKRVLSEAKALEDWPLIGRINQTWIDLRAAFAQTINKSQGSTYNTVFIDLDDVKRCRNANQLARMMYVGVSRARFKVVLTGDLV